MHTHIWRGMLASVMLVSALPVGACDVCGGASGGQTLGLLPSFSRHFAGIQYTYGGVESKHPSLFSGLPEEHSVQYTNSLQVWGRYKAGKNLQFTAFVPYIHNTYNDGKSLSAEGVGDITLMAGYVLLRPGEGKLTHSLMAGAGVKLPTGRYTGITERDQLGLPNIQPGTGSYDIPVNINYTLRHRTGGLNADVTYLLTTANRDNYKYGNRLSASLLYFYTLPGDRFSILPQAGFRLEQALHDYTDYKQQLLNKQSGGYMLFASGGVQAYYNDKIGGRLLLHLPVSYHYASGYVTPRAKVEAGVFFIF